VGEGIEMAQFESLYTVKISHDYYPGNRSEDFRVIPGGETLRWLRNHGFLFRSESSEFKVIAQVEPVTGGGVAAGRLPEPPVRHQFLLQLKQHDFLSYTNLPFHDSQKKIYYFSNLQSNISDGSKYLQSTSDHVTSVDQLSLRIGTLHYQVEGTAETKTARLLYPDWDIEEKKVVLNNEGIFDISFDLSDYPDGKAQLWIDGVKEETFYAMSRHNGSGIFGIVEIFHSDHVPVDYRYVDHQDKITTQQYHLSFQKRSTYWKYIVINKGKTEIEDPGIKYGEPSNSNGNNGNNGNAHGHNNGHGNPHTPPKYTFTQDTDGDYPDDYLVFISDQVIPLTRKGIDELSLRKKISSADRIVLDHLPNPDRNELEEKKDEPGKYYSKVFLYI